MANDLPKPLFDKSGGYRRLTSFAFATMIHLGTIRFCKRFLTHQDDPLGKTAGQMIGAARSGRQNIIEGSERASTSKETEIRLTDVARASLAELLGDYEIYLAAKGIIPWGRNDDARQRLGALQVPPFEPAGDGLHGYWEYFHQARKPFAQWLENDDDTVVANAMLVLIQRTTGMLDGQLRRQGQTFLDDGGFKERMHDCRTAAREKAQPDPAAPTCPECGKPMRQRTPRTGKNAGQPFWGCTAYPACHGTRNMQA